MGGGEHPALGVLLAPEHPEPGVDALAGAPLPAVGVDAGRPHHRVLVPRLDVGEDLLERDAIGAAPFRARNQPVMALNLVILDRALQMPETEGTNR